MLNMILQDLRTQIFKYDGNKEKRDIEKNNGHCVRDISLFGSMERLELYGC